MTAKSLTLAEKTERTYQFVEKALLKRMEAQEKIWNRQDRKRIDLIQRHKNRQQSRLELQKKAGQMITTTSMYVSTQPPPSLKELPELTRRAIRNGEFLPHSKHCCISQHNHTLCMIPTAIIKEAIALNEDFNDAPKASVAQKSFKSKPVNYEVKRNQALNHFKQLASIPEQALDVQVSARPERKRAPQSLEDLIGDDPLRGEFLSGLATSQFKPDEIRTLVEQEKRDRLGSSLIEKKEFTTSEHLELPQYSGCFDELDKTRQGPAPDQHLSVMKASLAQMLKIGKLTQKMDSEGILAVELAPETRDNAKRRLSKLKKQVQFAEGNTLHKKGYKDEESSDHLVRDEFEESDRGFESEVCEAPREEKNEAQKEIDWFLKKHRLE